MYECVLYVEVFPSNTGHQFWGVQCSTQNTRSNHCQCVCSGFLHFQVLSHTVYNMWRALSYIWTSFHNDHTWMCTVSTVLCFAQKLCSAQAIVTYLKPFSQRSHLNVVSCCAQVLCSAIALRQAGNWWKWQFLHGAQIINGQFLVPCYSLPMTMCSLLLPCMTALSLPGQLFLPHLTQIHTNLLQYKYYMCACQTYRAYQW